MNFLKELKLAVINRDLKKLETLSNYSPTFSSIDEAKEINSYLQEAVKILKEEKLKVFKEMQKIKKLKEFQNNQNKGNFNFKG